jgi:hypothetical protein
VTQQYCCVTGRVPRRQDRARQHALFRGVLPKAAASVDSFSGNINVSANSDRELFLRSASTSGYSLAEKVSFYHKEDRCPFLELQRYLLGQIYVSLSFMALSNSGLSSKFPSTKFSSTSTVCTYDTVLRQHDPKGGPRLEAVRRRTVCPRAVRVSPEP